jgi:DNA polymerase-2
MTEHTGWLFDLYPDPQDGVVLWLLCDDGQRRRFTQSFPVTFFAAGPPERLRGLWRSQATPMLVELARGSVGFVQPTAAAKSGGA